MVTEHAVCDALRAELFFGVNVLVEKFNFSLIL